MSYRMTTPLALGIVALGALVSAGASAQDKDKPIDLKPLVPPVFSLPPNSQLNSGTLGGSTAPYTTAPLQSPTSAPASPGIRLSIPTRKPE